MGFLKKLPIWGKKGVEPPNSKKAVGWQAEENPQAEYMNWFQSKTYDALKELQENATHKDETTVVNTKLAETATKIGSDVGLPVWLERSLFDITKQIDSHIRQYGVNVTQPPFNAKGDGISDDTQIIQDAINYAFDNGRLSVYFPNGKYLLSKTIIVPPLVDLLGQSKEGVLFYVEHNKWGFEIAINKLVSRPYQGGSAKYQKFTIRRKETPTVAIPENYGIYTKGTFGITVFEDIKITNMGDHACFQFDPTTAGTGPVYYNNCIFISNFFGYGYYAQGTFVNIYFNNSNSWGNGGGFYFDGTKTIDGGVNASSYLPNNIVIQNSDSEYAGGFHASGTVPPSGKTYTKPVIYAKKVSGIVLKNSVFHNTINYLYGHTDYITGIATAEFVSCLSVSIENSQFQNKLGKGNNTLVLTDCDYVNINTGTMLLGYKPGTTENADHLLQVDSMCKNIMLYNPKIYDGNSEIDVYLDGSINPIFVVKNSGQIGFLRSIYNNAYWKLNLTPQGPTSNRPSIGISPGFMYFDTSLQVPIWWNGSKWLETKKGTLTYNGDGMTTTKTIAHGLTGTPSFYHVNAASNDAGEAGIKFVTADNTNLTVTFNTPPIAGRNNIKLTWKAES
ncbi:hypothetical protein J2Y73_004006 [Peribacillus frigoritolerans]|jgi:hypothetical protein|uniref:glycoside hydrolase family 55 protein n=1 Tax=Peribacillus frigoritolerans TaxID=450367 RepID=UPI0020A18B84|nr:glycoside hydrolase family 55 protein [Peribacillus frigoritolerans]MCP1493975.1 hypothetical protein [Peribacillus frigoritolerans]